jgi:hypothetical protein
MLNFEGFLLYHSNNQLNNKTSNLAPPPFGGG